MDLKQFTKVRLVEGKTSLTRLARMSDYLGIELYVKRDDNTGFALGGNKARKLEYLMGDAVKLGANLVITTGGTQSNHARMTAAAAAKLGMKCVLLLTGNSSAQVQGNLLLDKIFGAEIRYIQFANLSDYFAQIEVSLEQIARETIQRGDKPYIIPVGGAGPIGALGYLEAVGELKEQMLEQNLVFDTIVHASGTGGTQAGILLGLAYYCLQPRVFGIGVGKDKPVLEQHIYNLCSQVSQIIEKQLLIKSNDIFVYDEFLGADYSLPTPEGIEAVNLLARKEGILLDPIYTGKAMAGLIELTMRGEIKQGEKVLFWHTGGSPAVFAYSRFFDN